jgi:hypothetical protein
MYIRTGTKSLSHESPPPSFFSFYSLVKFVALVLSSDHSLDWRCGLVMVPLFSGGKLTHCLRPWHIVCAHGWEICSSAWAFPYSRLLFGALRCTSSEETSYSLRIWCIAFPQKSLRNDESTNLTSEYRPFPGARWTSFTWTLDTLCLAFLYQYEGGPTKGRSWCIAPCFWSLPAFVKYFWHIYWIGTWQCSGVAAR